MVTLLLVGCLRWMVGANGSINADETPSYLLIFLFVALLITSFPIGWIDFYNTSLGGPTEGEIVFTVMALAANSVFIGYLVGRIFRDQPKPNLLVHANRNRR